MPGPADLHDSSPGAVAARRAHWRRRDEAPRRAAARDGSKRRASTGLRLPAIKSPQALVRSQDAGDKAGLAALLFFGLLAVATLRRGSWPHARDLGYMAGGTIVVVIASLVAPDVVIAVLAVALVILAITNAQVIVGFSEWLGGGLQRAVAAA